MSPPVHSYMGASCASLLCAIAVIAATLNVFASGTLAVSVVTFGANESVDVNAAAVGYRYCCVQVL